MGNNSTLEQSRPSLLSGRGLCPGASLAAGPASSFAPAGITMHTLLGTPRYTAPEVLEQAALHKDAMMDGAPLRGSYDSALDLWAAGVILYKMLCGHMPFESGQEWELYQKIRRGEYSMVRERAVVFCVLR